MSMHDRRRFIAGATSSALFSRGLPGQAGSVRKMKSHLVCSSLGVKASPTEAIELASRHGFEMVEPNGVYLASLSESDMGALLAGLKAKRLEFGTAGLPVDFRRDDAQFEAGLRELPGIAKALQRAGVRRVGTYITPNHATLTYPRNFKRHSQRLREAAGVLGEHDLRLGLEYVGPKTSWISQRFPFIHTMAETKELIADMGRRNVGLVLDCWHWHMAGEKEEDLLSLRNEDIVSADISDAPAGIPIDQQMDLRRELPLATGVIDLATFLNALKKVGYDGPVRVEPFNEELRKLPAEQAVAKAAQSLARAFALIQ